MSCRKVPDEQDDDLCADDLALRNTRDGATLEDPAAFIRRVNRVIGAQKSA